MSYQPTYAYAAPQPYGPPPSNGLAVASFVLGIIAILGCLVPFLNVISIVLAIISLILGAVALSVVRRGRAGGGGLAIAGIVLSALSIVGAVLMNAFVFHTMGNFGALFDEISTAQTARPEAAARFPGATAHDVVAQPGESITLRGMAITTTALVAQENATGPAVCTTVTYVNGGTTTVPVGSAEWVLQEPSGWLRAPGPYGAPDDLVPVDLAPAGTVTGDVCFEGAADPGEYVLLFDDGVLDPVTSQVERGAWLSTL